MKSVAQRALILAIALVLAGCGSPTPTPSLSSAAPSASLAASATEPTSPALGASPSPLPAARATIGSTGGSAAAGGVTVDFPAAALRGPTTVSLAGAAALVGPPSAAWPAQAVGPTWTIDVGGTKLAKPVTLTLPYDTSALPAGTDASEVMLAYLDAASGRWIPVPATVDPVAHTITASVSHLSTWGTFTINWDYYLGFIGKVASGNLTDLLGALGSLTTTCVEKSPQGFTVDNGATNGMIKGCVQKVANGQATIGVTNMRAISFALSGGGLDSGAGSILDAGDTVTFTAGGTKLAQPLVASASLSPLALGYQLTDITLRLLPGSDVFTKAGSYAKVLEAIATAEAKVWTNAQILAKLQKNPPDVAGAAEEAFSLMTDHSFLGVFAAAAVAAGQKYGVPYLSALTPARLNQLFLAVNLVVLDTTVLSWDVQYFLAGYGEVKVTWPVPPAAPQGLGSSAPFQVTHPDGSIGEAITMHWTKPLGSVSGYRIETWWFMTMVWQGPGTPPPLPPCGTSTTMPWGRESVTVPGSATSYTLDLGESGPTCMFISAINAAGTSPKAKFPPWYQP